MIGVKNEDTVHGTGQHWINMVVFRRNSKAHVQEVRCIIEVVARVHKRLTN